MTAEEFYNRRGFSRNTDRSYSDKVYDAIYNSAVTDITSREQIINPYEILDTSQYVYSNRGHSLYDEDLNALIAIQKQQQAAYDEWYDSASQQILRERQAGLNPDLIGNVDSGESASTEPLAGSSPMDPVPNDVDIANSVLSSVSSLIHSSAQIAALPTSFAQARLAGSQSKLVDSQLSGQELNNLKSFEGLVYSAAAGRFADAASSAADAGTPFDVDAFFAPDSNSFDGIFEAYAPVDDSRYRAAYTTALKNVQKIKGEGYKLSGDAVSQQTTFAEALSNPYFDSDLLSQIALMEPVMKFQEDVRILNLQYQENLYKIKNKAITEVGDTAIDAFLKREKASAAESKYKIDYFANFKGDDAALYDMYQKKFTALRTRAIGDVYNNYWSIWKKDPLSTKGLGASYFITNGEHMKWFEYLGMFGLSNSGSRGSGSNNSGSTNNDGVGFSSPQNIVIGNDTTSYPTRPFGIFDIPFNL